MQEYKLCCSQQYRIRNEVGVIMDKQISTDLVILGGSQ